MPANVAQLDNSVGRMRYRAKTLPVYISAFVSNRNLDWGSGLSSRARKD